MSEDSSAMIVNNVNESTDLLATTCSWCALGPPPSMILQIPPPPVPAFLVADYYPSAPLSGSDSGPAGGLTLLDNNFNGSPCRHSCEWRGAEGVHYVEIPQQGSVFDDTWLLVLISSCVGVVLIGIVLAAMLIKCKLQPDDVSRHVNDDASQCSSRSNKNSTLSTSTASSSMQTTTTSGTGPCLSSKTIARLQNEAAAVLFPCGSAAAQEDSRVMWATLTPRGTTRHYLEEHTYETIGSVCHNVAALGHQPTTSSSSSSSPVPPAQPPPPPTPVSYVTSGMLGLGQPHHQLLHHHHHHRRRHQQHQHHVQQQLERRRHYSDNHPSEHVNLKSYNEPPAPSPVMTRSKDEKAFDNTAFVDYEEPHSMKNEYYQLDDVLEPCDPIFSVQGMYGMPPRSSSSSGGGGVEGGAGGAGGGGGGGGGGVGPSSNIVVVGTPRPRVSSPTRIEHPNLPPLNLQPTLPRSKHRARKNSINHNHHHQQQQQQHPSPTDCALLRGAGGGAAYVPTI